MLEVSIRIILFFICNTCLILSTFGYIKFLKVEKSSNKYVSSIVLYFFRILVFELILGFIFKCLNYYTMTITSLLEFVVVLFIYNKRYSNFFIDVKSSIKNIIDNVKEYKNKISKNKIKFNFNTIFFIIFIISFIVITTVSMFVYEYSFDGNYYHLPHIIDYVQTESIQMTNNTLWNNVYPQNIELLNMFYMLFTNSIFGVRIVQVVFALLGVIVTYKLMKLINFDKNVSYICALLYFASPFILAQITTTYIDGVMVTLFITLLYYLVRIIKYSNIYDELLFYITLSIFMGVKGTCAIYAVIIVLPYVIFKLYCLKSKKEKFKTLVLKCIVAILIVGIIGCNWLILNFFRFGNPLHPFAFLNIEGLDASVDIGIENEPKVFEEKTYLEKMLISWLGLDSGYLDVTTGFTLSSLIQYPDKRVGGMGVLWTFLFIPSMIVSLVLLITKKYKTNFFQLLIIAIVVVSFIVTPANWWGRYVGFIILLGYISFGILYEVLKNCNNKNKILNVLNILNTYILVLYIVSIACSSYHAISNFAKGYYWNENQEFIEYINSDEKKNIIFLEESYYLGANYLVLLKGNNLQNEVNTYYIEEMYKNASVANHNIQTYEEFCKIIDQNQDVNMFVLVDASALRKNYEFLERYYSENKEKIEKLIFGKDIIVYEKSN